MLDTLFPNLFLLSASVALPILASLIVWGLGKTRFQAGRIVGIGAAALPLLILAFAAFRLSTEIGLQLGDRFDFWPDLGISVALAIDGLSLPFALLAAALGVLGVSSARSPHELALALLAQATSLLLFVSEDLFIFLGAWWALPLLLYALINGWGRGRAEYAATKFLAMLLTGSALLTVSLLAIYLVGNGNGSMAALWITKPGFPVAFLNHWVLAGILLSAWVAAPLFPFHTWLADVFDTAPPSALPLVVGGVQAGAAYAFVRLAMGLFPSYMQPWLPWMAALGVLTALYALMASWGQRSLLRALALAGVAVAGIALAGFSAVSGPEVSTAVGSTLNLTLAAVAAGGLLTWLSAELTVRAGATQDLLARLGFLTPRGAASWLTSAGLTLVLLVVAMVFMVSPVVEANRLALTIGMGLALMGLILTAENALRRTLRAPATPARVDGVEDLTARELALGWGSLLLAAIPILWLILGSRAIAVFASQLSLGFVR